MQTAARTFGLQLHVLNASTESDFNAVFAKLIQLRAGGLVIARDPFFASQKNSSPHWRSATRCPLLSSIARSLQPEVC